MIKSGCLFFIFSLFAFHLYAQSPSGTDYRFRASFIPAGLTYISGFRGSENIFTDYYLTTATTGRSNTLSLELAYQTENSVIIFGRYENLTMGLSNDLSTIEHNRFLEEQYARSLYSEGHEMLYGVVNDGSMLLHGFSLGAGYTFELDPFSIEPYLAARGIFGKPYQVFMRYKKMDQNHYFEERFDAKKFFSLAPVAGIKFNLRIKGRWGLTVEPSYSLLPLKLAYDYSFQDSDGPGQQRKIEEKFLLSRVQINIGTYFNFLRR